MQVEMNLRDVFATLATAICLAAIGRPVDPLLPFLLAAEQEQAGRESKVPACAAACASQNSKKDTLCAGPRGPRTSYKYQAPKIFLWRRVGDVG